MHFKNFPKFKCPFCKGNTYFNFDMTWGRCHFFLHCKNQPHLTIGIDLFDQIEIVMPKLLKYAKKNNYHYIEYYDNRIQKTF